MNNFLIAGIITWIYIGIMEIRLYNALSVAKKNKENIEKLSDNVELINYGALPFVRQLAKIHAEDITEIRKEVAELSKMRVGAVPVRHAKLLNAHPYGECSNCGYLIDIREEFNYCPNCGARMVEE